MLAVFLAVVGTASAVPLFDQLSKVRKHPCACIIDCVGTSFSLLSEILKKYIFVSSR